MLLPVCQNAQTRAGEALATARSGLLNCTSRQEKAVRKTRGRDSLLQGLEPSECRGPEEGRLVWARDSPRTTSHTSLPKKGRQLTEALPWEENLTISLLPSLLAS